MPYRFSSPNRHLKLRDINAPSDATTRKITGCGCELKISPVAFVGAFLLTDACSILNLLISKTAVSWSWPVLVQQDRTEQAGLA